jgi:acylphosphatase
MQAITATVGGNVQEVGFRAAIFKQAIEYNLAGTVRNNTNGTVQFDLQGDKNRIDQAVITLRNGTKKSSDVTISTATATVEPGLDKFTIMGWTSASRNITTPYDLVFTLRAADDVISRQDAKAKWHEILAKTLSGEDLKKIGVDED